MAEEKPIKVKLSARRQITLPKEACDLLGVQPGDTLVLELVDSKVVLKPRKMSAIEALRAIQDAFQKSGITEEELQAEGRRIREELVREKYGDLLK